MKHRSLFIVSMVASALAAVGWYRSRPVLVVTEDSPLWASEYDAYRQGSLHPGRGVPQGQMSSGEYLRALWITEGKDYRAAFVVRDGGRSGWVLLWQRGIAPHS